MSLVAKPVLPSVSTVQPQGSSSGCCRMSWSASPRRKADDQSRIFTRSMYRKPKPVNRRRIGLTICEVALKVEGAQGSKATVGSKIRVKGPLKVYHVQKRPEFELGGYEGEVKEVLTSWKGQPISANLPFKVQFVLPGEDGKEVKFVAHLRDDEFEVIG